MKILAIGDFHGKIPYFIKKVIKKEKPDLIISPGDFCAFYQKKLFFKYCYEKQLPLEEFIGKRKTIAYIKRDIASGKRVIKYLKKLKISIIAVSGNVDPAKYGEIAYYAPKKSSISGKYYSTDILRKEESKNFKIIDFKAKKFQDYAIIGSHKSSYPGFIHGKKNQEHEKFKKRKYKGYKKKLIKLFLKNKNKKIIFLSHNTPYKKMDLVRDKKAHKLAKGVHKGSYLTREIIKKYQPLLCICGHMHENQRTDKIGRTLIVNPGAACEGKYAIITIKDNKLEVKFKK